MFNLVNFLPQGSQRLETQRGTKILYELYELCESLSVLCG